MPSIDAIPGNIKRRNPKRGGKQLSPGQWAEIEGLWETGEFSRAELSKRYKISGESLSRHFKKKGLVKGSKGVGEAVKNAIASEVADEATQLLKRARETREDHYRWSTAMARAAMAEIATAQRDQTPVADRVGNLKAIQSAMAILESARKERWSILGLDKDQSLYEEMPELVVREYSADEVESIRQDDLDEDDLDTFVDDEDSLDVDYDGDGDEGDDIIEET